MRDMTDDQRDPVESGLGDRYDLYDVATWEVRGRLDAFAVRLTASLRAARRWLLILIALALFIAQVAVAGLLIAERPVLGGLALVSIVPALALAGYLWYEDPTRREPLELLAATFLLSILFASFASVVNTLFFPAFSLFGAVGFPLFFFVVVGPIEETVKWLAIRVHAYRSDSFDAVIDGVVYGAVAGLGFAAIENLIYIINVFLQTADAGMSAQLQSVIDTTYLRAFVGPGHVIYSAFAGYYLGLAKFNPENRGPIVVKGLVIAVFIHALYNSLVTFLSPTGMSLAAFVIVYDGVWLVVLYRKIARYKSLYQEARSRMAGRTDPDAHPAKTEFDAETAHEQPSDAGATTAGDPAEDGPEFTGSDQPRDDG
jgi:RsiW-degrading membrane proteinase PrsW (M82 family)